MPDRGGHTSPTIDSTDLSTPREVVGQADDDRTRGRHRGKGERRGNALADIRGGDVVSHDQQTVAHEHGHVEIDNALGLELAQQVADRNLFNVVHDGDGERMRLGQVCGETFRKSHLVELVLGVVERNAQRFFEYELLAVLQRDLSRR